MFQKGSDALWVYMDHLHNYASSNLLQSVSVCEDQSSLKINVIQEHFLCLRTLFEALSCKTVRHSTTVEPEQLIIGMQSSG